MKKATSKRLSRRKSAELKSLAALPDHAIDTSDAPELPDWSGARRGLFYWPVKQQLGLDEFRLDHLTHAQLRGLLGFAKREGLDRFLKAHGIYASYTMDDLQQERQDLRRLGF